MAVTLAKKPGLAMFQSEDYTEAEVFSGDFPTPTTNEMLLNPAADLPAYTVVGRITATGKITISNSGASDGSQQPIGITCYFVPNPAADELISVYRGGMFNPARLNWHASWTTDEQKRLAFEAKQPTIFIKKIG